MNHEGAGVGLELMRENSPMKAFKHRYYAVIAAAVIIAAVVFIRSRLKTLKSYRDEAKAGAEDG